MKIYFLCVGLLFSYNLELVNSLSNLGINIVVDAQSNLARLMLLHEKIKGNCKAKIRYISVLPKLIPLKSYFGTFDLVHLNSISSYSMKVAKIANCPKIFVLHEAPIPKSVYDVLKGYVDMFVAPSEFTAKNEAPKVGFTPIVIHHGVNMHLFNDSIQKDVARRKLHIPYNAKVVLWNDRISPEKDLETLLKAIPLIAREAPDVYFYIKGRAVNKGYLRRIEMMLKNCKKRRNVKIHVGWIPYEKLPLLYRSADVFVRTSLYENFGLGFVEAMACGVPVIVADVPIAREVLGEAALFFKPRDSMDLADKVIYLLSNSDEGEILARKGLRRVKEKFTLNMMTQKYLNLYRSLVERV
ncbi:MAG: glycosyltransferase family 4 protein [Nitrososphaerota archaeon]